MGLLRAMRPDADAVLSWSTVDAPALVLGRSHGPPPLDEVAARESGVAVVRRSSGGGPVLWDGGLLAFDLVLPPAHPLAPVDVVEAYRPVGEAVADALVALGLSGVELVSIGRSRAAARAPSAAAAACYGGISPYEVLIGGRKVLGLSQSRRRSGALLQGGIILELDAVLTARLMGRDAAFARALEGHAAGLHEYRTGIDANAVVDAVEEALAERTGMRLRSDIPTGPELDAIVESVEELAVGR